MTQPFMDGLISRDYTGVMKILNRIVPLLVVFGLAWPALADGDDDHDEVLRAVQSGEILPLAEILKRLEDVGSGQILEVELEREHGRTIYEIKLLTGTGQILELEVDAATGRPLGQPPPKDDDQADGEDDDDDDGDEKDGNTGG